MIKKIFIGIWQFIKGSLMMILGSLSLLATVLYVLAIAAPYIPPVYTVLPAVLGMVFPLVLGFFVVMLGYWVIIKRWRIALPMALIFAICLPNALVYFPINRTKPLEEEVEERQSLRILSYNVNAFRFRRHTTQSPNPILQYIKASEADIVCLQEALLVDDPRQGVTYRQIQKYLGDLYPYIRKDYAQPHGGSMLILLSKFPINDHKRLPLTSSANGAMMYRIQMPDGETTVFNLHLESFRLKKRDGEDYIQFLKDRNAIGLKDAIRGKFTPTFERHNIQANTIQTSIAAQETDRIIVCGDFNDTPLSYTRHKIGTGLRDAFVEAGNGPGISFSTWFFLVRIDHILLGRAFEPISCFVDRSISTSDHYPIQTTVLY